MTTPNEPFRNDPVDPFVPEPVRVPLADGTDAIDLGVTAINHAEAPLPQIDSSILRVGDILKVEFDTDHEETFKVAALHAGSLVFGSDEVLRPEALLERRTNSAADGQPIKLYGSTVSPTGMMRTPGTIRVGSFMLTDLGISRGAIRTFDLKRPDENGNLQPVMLNQREANQESDSFSAARQTFYALSALLAQRGFTFENNEASSRGRHPGYSKVSGKLLVYAARQGFGSAVTPQDEIYVYSARTQVLRGLRSIPTKGIMQALVVRRISKDNLQKAGVGYRGGHLPDWRYSALEGAVVCRLAKDAPVVSYTWLSMDQENPIITVLEYGERISEVFRTPKQKGEAFVENMAAHGGEAWIERLSRALNIDPHDSEHIYDRLLVDIYPGKQAHVHDGNPYLWTSQELATAFGRRVQDLTEISHRKNNIVLTVDGHKIRIARDAGKEIERMAKATELVLNTRQRFIGSRLLARLYR